MQVPLIELTTRPASACLNGTLMRTQRHQHLGYMHMIVKHLAIHLAYLRVANCLFDVPPRAAPPHQLIMLSIDSKMQQCNVAELFQLVLTMSTTTTSDVQAPISSVQQHVAQQRQQISQQQQLATAEATIGR